MNTWQHALRVLLVLTIDLKPIKVKRVELQSKVLQHSSIMLDVRRWNVSSATVRNSGKQSQFQLCLLLNCSFSLSLYPKQNKDLTQIKSCLLSLSAYLAQNTLGEFAKLWEATISFVTSVCPSAWNNSTPTGRIYIEFEILVFFENMPRKSKFL